ncbi:MAG: cadherin-like domain-containing protein [Trueperaceae bacterium]|nr:cadherin-like domain-containing protein [Trueperaceae bacterium]
MSTQKNVAVTFGLQGSDVDGGSDPDTDAAITDYRIESLPAWGTLEVVGDGEATVGTALPRAQAEGAAALRFVPETNRDGSTEFTFRAIDAAGVESDPATVTLEVAEFNEPPSLTVPGPQAMDEDATLALPALAVTDLDAGTTDLTVLVEVAVAAQGSPTVADPGTLTFGTIAGLTVDEVDANGGTRVRVTGTLADLNTALADLAYAPAPDFFGTVTLTATVDDLGGSLDQDQAKDDTATVAIDVANVLDAPTTGDAQLDAVAVNSLDSEGERLSDLFLGTYGDVDGDALLALAVADDASTPGEGVWSYSTNNGVSWHGVGTVDPSSALALPAEALLRFVPAAGHFGEVGDLTVHALDATTPDGTAFTQSASRATVAVTALADEAWLDGAGGTATIVVTATDTPFTIEPGRALRVDEGGAGVLTPDELEVTDDEAGPASIVFTVAAGTDLAEGQLQLDVAGDGTWTALAEGGTFTQAQVNAGHVRYVHDGREPAAAQTIVLDVTDAIPGIGGSSGSVSVPVNVTPVNDPPVLYVPGDARPGDGQTLVAVAPQGGDLAFSTDVLVATDVDNADEQLIFRIDAGPTNGRLTVNGTRALAGRTFAYADLASVDYTHDGSTNLIDAFTVTLRDGAGGTVGPVAVPIDIAEVNIAPDVGSARATVFEGSTTRLTLPVDDDRTAAGDLTVSIDSLPATLGESLPEAVLEFDGAPVAVGFVLGYADLDRLILRHTAPEQRLPADVAFDVIVTDTGTEQRGRRPLDARQRGRDRAARERRPGALRRPVGPAGPRPVRREHRGRHGRPAVRRRRRLRRRHLPSRAAAGARDAVPERRPAGRGRHLHPGRRGRRADRVPQRSDAERDRRVRRHRARRRSHLRGRRRWRRHRSDRRRVRRRALRALEVPIDITFTPAAGGGIEGPGGIVLDPIDPVTGDPVAGGGENPGTGAAVARDDPLADAVRGGTPIAIPASALLGNDSGVDPLAIQSVASPVGGTVVLETGGSVTFTPTRTFAGTASFSYTLEDGEGDTATATAAFTVFFVNLEPTLATNETLVLDEGASAPIGSASLQVVDDDQAPAELRFVLDDEPVHGLLRLDGRRLHAGERFTQADVDAGRLAYHHDGGERFLDAFDVSYTDGSEIVEPATFAIDATPLNDRPVLEVRDEVPLALQGGSVAIDDAVLRYLDDDGEDTDKPAEPLATPNDLAFSVGDAPSYGEVRRQTAASYDPDDPATYEVVDATSSVPAADVLEGRLRYQHDGSVNYADAFTLVVDDGTGAVNARASAVVTIDIAPQNIDPVVDPDLELGEDGELVIVNELLVVLEGATRTLSTTEHLGAFDPDNTAVQVQFRLVDDFDHGRFLFDGAPLGVNSAFSQADLIDGRLAYRHDGGQGTSDAATLRLSDGGGGDEPQIRFRVQITPVNDAPTLTTAGDRVGAEDVELALVGIAFDDPDAYDTSGTLLPDAGPFVVEVTSAGLGTLYGDRRRRCGPRGRRHRRAHDHRHVRRRQRDRGDARLPRRAERQRHRHRDRHGERRRLSRPRPGGRGRRGRRSRADRHGHDRRRGRQHELRRERATRERRARRSTPRRR